MSQLGHCGPARWVFECPPAPQERTHVHIRCYGTSRERADKFLSLSCNVLECSFAYVRFAPILLKKSKIEWLQNSRECQFLVVAAARSLCRTCTKVPGRFCANRCGPSRRRVSDAPAGLKNFAHELEGTFSTISANSGRSITAQYHN